MASPVVSSENTPAAQPQQVSSKAELVENAAQPTEEEGLSGLITQPVAAPEITPENIQADDTAANRLKQEEQELARAVANFQDGIVAMADKKISKFLIPITKKICCIRTISPVLAKNCPISAGMLGYYE